MDENGQRRRPLPSGERGRLALRRVGYSVAWNPAVLRTAQDCNTRLIPLAKPFIRTLIATVAVLAWGGCGNDESGHTSGLGTNRFEAIDAVLVASLPLDRFRREAVDPTTFAAAVRPFRTACNALDKDDALLARIRARCQLRTELNEYIIVFAACAVDNDAADQFNGCLGSIRQVQKRMRMIQRQDRQTDRVIRRLALAPACRHALTSGRAYAIYEAYLDAFALLARAARAQDSADIDEGMRLLAAADAKNQDLPSSNQVLRQFRRSCA